MYKDVALSRFVRQLSRMWRQSLLLPVMKRGQLEVALLPGIEMGKAPPIVLFNKNVVQI